MSEIDVQSKKNVSTALTSAYKKSKIKEHNIKAALKNERKNREDATFLGSDYKKSTPKSDSLNKARRKELKTQKFIDKHEEHIEKKGADAPMVRMEKDKLKYMGVYRDKKGGEVLEAPKGAWTKTKKDTFKTAWDKRQKKQGGGAALRGLGRAFLKGGKV